MHTKKTISIASALLAGTLALYGCGSNSNNSSGAGSSAEASVSATHNKADTTFAQDMIPHHGQALEMAKMANKQAASGQVKQLAAEIEAAQRPEIMKMTGWLKAWGATVPSTGMAGMSGMGHGSHSKTPGMMSNADMRRLQNAHGAAFDQMFLQMMIEHHQGALDMAKTELAQGKNPAAVRLAKSIESSQAAQIAKMRQMLKA